MSETKHTPGPWSVYDQRHLFTNHEGSARLIAGDIWIACVHGSHVGPQSKEEADANISLIAAAPELLEALKLVVAIAKEAHAHWDAHRDNRVGKILLALAGANESYDKRIDAIHAAIAKAKGEQP